MRFDAILEHPRLPGVPLPDEVADKIKEVWLDVMDSCIMQSLYVWCCDQPQLYCYDLRCKIMFLVSNLHISPHFGAGSGLFHERNWFNPGDVKFFAFLSFKDMWA